MQDDHSMRSTPTRGMASSPRSHANHGGSQRVCNSLRHQDREVRTLVIYLVLKVWKLLVFLNCNPGIPGVYSLARLDLADRLRFEYAIIGLLIALWWARRGRRSLRLENSSFSYLLFFLHWRGPAAKCEVGLIYLCQLNIKNGESINIP